MDTGKNKNEEAVYDYVILGGGAAGLSLAYRMAIDPFFQNKKIAVVEPNEKNTNDRTWCFWEKTDGLFDSIVKKKWSKLMFYGPEIEKELTIDPYVYKMISGIDFYRHTIPRIKSADHITWIPQKVMSINEGAVSSIQMEEGQIQAKIIFKSFPERNAQMKSALYVDQHFKGFIIRTEQDAFDPEVATFMDFRIDQKGEARFFYVLPQTKNEALVEVAIFSNNHLSQDEYNQVVKDYIQTYLPVKGYQILEEEYGVIPMTTYDFHKHNTKHIFHIGTGGGIVKASSGYAFKRIQEHSDLIIDCLKNGINLDKTYHPFNNRFKLYDKTMLHAMLENGVEGSTIFSKLFSEKKASAIFKFLDQETHFFEELSIFTAPPWLPFTQSFLKVIFK